MPGKVITLLDDDQWPAAGFGFELPIEPERTALGVIDVQFYGLDPAGHLAQKVQAHSTEVYAEYARRSELMLENIQKLLAAFRDAGRRVFYTRHGALAADGGDLALRRRGREQHARSAGDGTSGHLPIRGERAHEIADCVAPQPGELVLDKNTSSAFHTTPIDLVLRNMNADTLILTGVAADQCVLATAIDAADRGFHVILVPDACAGFDPGSAEAVQILFGRVWGYVIPTEAVLEWFRTGKKPSTTRLPARPLGGTH